MKAYVREIAWVAIAQGVAFVGGLATVKVAAVVLGPSEYGKLSVGLAAIGIFQVCLYGAVSQTATRFLAFAGSHGQLQEYDRALAKLAGIAALVIMLVLAVVTLTGIRQWLPVPASLLAVYTIINGFQAIMLAVFNAARKRQLVAILAITEALLRPSLIFALTRSPEPTANQAMTGYVLTVGTIAVMIVAFRHLLGWSSLERVWSRESEPPTMQGRSLTWDMVFFAAPFVIFGLLGAMGSHGERLLLAQWVSWSDVGSYALMAQLVVAPNVLFTSAVNQFYFPLIFQSDPDGTRHVGRGFRLYLLASVMGIVAITASVAALGPHLIPLFSSRDFLGSEHLLWYLGVSAGLFSIGQQLVLPGLRLNRPAVYMPAKLLHSVVLLGTSVRLVPAWGLSGMGIASLAAATAYLLATLMANVWLGRTMARGEICRS
ncbi:lipopolysaccharide biosynthesis protein [Bradyrhizobium sp. HKCCYLS20291]|uniref:lipopolysaccharide biosynthesis protein n=1 Tax=Bradyrhizobium sp. HKCCYLS20291 TaxID=3420766 RepID=UPI003EBB09D7